jgi:hypothetical protein
MISLIATTQEHVNELLKSNLVTEAKRAHIKEYLDFKDLCLSKNHTSNFNHSNRKFEVITGEGVEDKTACKKKSIHSRFHVCRRLPKRAIKIMRSWLESHLRHPYPSLEEKQDISKKGGISILQVILFPWNLYLKLIFMKVQTWFINNRGRLDRQSYTKNPFKEEVESRLKMGMEFK